MASVYVRPLSFWIFLMNSTQGFGLEGPFLLPFLLAFFPSLAILPVGVVAMLAALLVILKAATIDDRDERARMRAGLRLAWRITWMSFLWATFASGLGYLVMLIIALFMN